MDFLDRPGPRSSSNRNSFQLSRWESGEELRRRFHDDPVDERPAVSKDIANVFSFRPSPISARSELSAAQDSLYDQRDSTLLQPNNKATLSHGLWIKDWGLELLSCLASAAALAAIIATLSIHNNQPLPEWPFGVSINAVIGLLATTLRVTMILPIAEGISQLKWLWYRRPRAMKDLDRFDEASRGPLGSGKLLTRLKGGSLASVGALLTLLALAIDPFTQQVIRIKNVETVLSGSPSWISRSNNYTGSGPHKAAGLWDITPAMTKAFYTGVVDPARIGLQISPTCPTGNCTFSTPYRSLAVCSQCSNITHEIKRSGPIKGLPITYSLPNGLAMNSSSGYVMKLDSGYKDNFYPFGRASISDVSILLFDSYQVQYPGATAVECLLSFCTKTYISNITNNVLFEDITHVSYNDPVFATQNNSDPIPTPVEAEAVLVPDPCLLNGQLYPLSAVSGTQYAKSPSYYQLWNGTNSSYYPSDCVYLVDGVTVSAVRQFMGPALKGSVMYASVGPTMSSMIIGLMYNGGNVSIGSLNATLADISSSMTNEIRSANAAGPTATGVTTVIQTRIQVQWAWLALPASLLVLTIAFLVATMFKSGRQSQGRVWKSSSIALLHHGLEMRQKENTGPLDRLDQMEKVARRTRVRLTDLDGVWKFVQA